MTRAPPPCPCAMLSVIAMQANLSYCMSTSCLGQSKAGQSKSACAHTASGKWNPCCHPMDNIQYMNMFFTMHFPVHVHLISSGISDGNCLTCSANACPMSRLYVKALHYTYIHIYICTVTSCQCGKSMWVCKSISLSFSPCSYLLWWNLNVFSFAYVCLLFGFFSSFPPPIMFFNPIGRSQREWAG